jgi:serine protease Do
VVRDGGVRSLKVTVGNMADARQASATGGRATASRVADRLGVELQQGEKGVVVTDVKPESPADQAGIAEGDIIREVNRTRVERMEDLDKAATRDSGNGKQLLLRVERAGAERYVVVDVG